MDIHDKSIPNTLILRNKKHCFNMRRLRLSLKYRPEILKLVLKMRQCIRQKNALLKKLKHQLKYMVQKNFSNTEKEDQKGLDSMKSCNVIVNNLGNTFIDKSTSCEYSFKDSFSQTKNDDLIYVPHEKTRNILNLSDKVKNFTDEAVITDSLKGDSKCKLPAKEAFTQTDLISEQDCNAIEKCKIGNVKLLLNDISTQTYYTENNLEKSVADTKNDVTEKSLGWVNTDDGDKEKSIAEQVKEVAQSAMEQSGMVYVESAGMYYDYKTGYYYSSELGLYYHTDTGCYYYYSDDQKTFVFHSYPDRSHDRSMKDIRKTKKHRKAKQSDDIENLTKNFSQDEDNAEVSKPKKRRLSKHKKKTEKVIDRDLSVKETRSNNETECLDKENDIKETKVVTDSKRDDSKQDEEIEDGECSDSADETSLNSTDESDASTETESDDESVAKHHPPCMRVIVRETTLPKLKVGSLFLVTKDGGTIGREGEHHAIILKDYNVSRNHLDIKFNSDKRIYTAVDLGSKNGTVLNGVRMSDSQETSEPMEVVHGSTLQLGETKLLCHIHAGNDTCGHCEPGLIIAAEEKEKKVAYTRTCSVKKQHELELARLKNKYAPKLLEIEETAYNDRAQARREKVGSSHSAEKTQSSDLDTAIAADNKGFKLLEKMGWSKGEGLGKDSQGDTEPIPLVSNEGKTGLGASPMPSAAPFTSKIGPATLRLAARTKMLQPPAKAFQQPTEEDSE